jgi:DNA repair protein RecN (Recombination protein N)
LQLALGGRGEALWVREGRPRCEIAAEFDAPAAALPWLRDNGFDAEGDTLLLRRTIDAAGKSRAWVNGSPATVGQLRELADWLVDIHGQHAWQSLTRPAAVRALLDAYAGVDADALADAWRAWRQSEAALAAARAAQDSLAQERERLLWQVGEVDKLAPAEGEWDELNQRHARLSNAQALIDAAQAAIAALQGGHDNGGDSGGGALPALTRAQQALAARQDIEPEFAALAEALDASAAQLHDAAHTLHGWLRRTGPDPDQLAELDARMGQWIGLARRYRRPPEELPALLAGWRDELARLESSADLERLERAARADHDRYHQAARAVSAQRASAAPRLAAAVSAAMQDLGMAGGRFDVALTPLAEPAAHGLESAAFLVAAHAGSTPRAIDKVASGGELSRLALAIAVTTSQLGAAGTLVFDEVDAGVGGAVAATVGQLLRRLGQDRQVLCVTHLPQVAACADHHLTVSKQADGSGVAASAVTPVEGDARAREIARMLGGAQITETTLAHAQELLRPGPAAPPARKRKAHA